MNASASRRIGLVGGIASGKSLAARWFAEQGWSILDADQVAHELYAPGTSMCEAILSEFGPGVRAADGSVDRKALGAVVFSNPERLKDLEGIVHPAVRRELSERVEALAREGRGVVLEMALLARWPEMVERLDRVVGIKAPESLRIARLRERNGLSETEALQRLARQELEGKLISCASDVVVNDGSMEALAAALSTLFAPA